MPNIVTLIHAYIDDELIVVPRLPVEVYGGFRLGDDLMKLLEEEYGVEPYDAQVYVETYHRNAAGTETKLGTSNLTQVIDETTYNSFDVSALIPKQDWLASDRIVTKVYANKVGGAADPVLEMEVGS